MSFLRSMEASARHLLFRPVQGPLRALWLLLAQIMWVVLAAVAVGIFIMSLPAGFTQLHQVCAASTCPIFWQLSPHDLQALERLGISLDLYAAYNLGLAITLMISYLVIGIIIFWMKRRDGLALLLSLAPVLLGAIGLFSNQLLVLQPAWKAVIALLSFMSTVFALIFVYVFPTGRFAPRSLGWLVVVWIALQVAYFFFPDSVLSMKIWPPWLSTLIWVGSWVIGFLSQIYRYASVSTPIERQQTKWVVFGLVVSLCLLLVGGLVQVFMSAQNSVGEAHVLSRLTEQLVGVLAFVLPPICIGIAILRYRLWDIDLIINRTLVYGILTVSGIGLYVLVVVGLGTLFQGQGNLLLSLGATGLIAVIFQPLRQQMQQAINRLMYGERDHPYQVISRLGQRLETTLAPEAVLPLIVETVAQSLKLPYVAIRLMQGEELVVAASYGQSVETTLTLPLVYQMETIGQLLLAPRARGDAFTPADRRLLDDLARQAGIAAHAVHLTSELQRAREKLVTTREEERRRLRRDLHDGLGPTLAALNLQAGAVRTLIAQDPEQASAMVVEWRRTLRTVIADIRRLVYELRPPALDELGLVGAIHEQAAQYCTRAEGPGVSMTVEAPDHLPTLPAAVEVAAYRIAQEALANVTRHAQAHTCQVRLRLDDELHMEITDDGIGLPGELRAGVGLFSMRERAEELGGSCTIESAGTLGTHVCVRLPFPKE